MGVGEAHAEPQIPAADAAGSRREHTLAKLIEYNVEGVEEGGGGTGVKAPPGVYVARIALCEDRRGSAKADGEPANDIRVGLDLGPEYDWGFTYIGLGPESDWKLAEFVRALGLKDKGKINPDKIVADKVLIRVKMNPDSYEGGVSSKPGRLMKKQPEDTKPGRVGTISPSSTTPTNGDQPNETPAEPETTGKVYANPDFIPFREGGPDPSQPDDPEAVVGAYEDWPDDDLFAECEDRGITLPGGRGSKRDKAIVALRAEDAEVLGSSYDETEPEAEGAAEPAAAATNGTDDYDDWDLAALTKEWSDRELGDLPSIRGSNAEARMIKALVEGIREDDKSNPFEP